MKLSVRLARREPGRARREGIVAAALAAAEGRSGESERLLDRRLPASSLLSALHLGETEPGEERASDNGNFSGAASS